MENTERTQAVFALDPESAKLGPAGDTLVAHREDGMPKGDEDDRSIVQTLPPCVKSSDWQENRDDLYDDLMDFHREI